MTESYTVEEFHLMKPAAKPSKYRNKPQMIDGIRFASIAEAKKYGELKLMVSAGLISGFDCQVDFPLLVEGVLVATYRADFVVYQLSGDMEVIDVKGAKKGAAWQAFVIKQKLMKATKGIDVIVCN